MRLPECQRERHGLSLCQVVTQLEAALAKEKQLNAVLMEKFADVSEKLARCLAGKMNDRLHPPDTGHTE